MLKVKVHWNLHVGGFSVTDRKTGKIIPGLTDNITILNPIAKLQQGKYHDCHNKGKRHVCAWIIGDLVEYQGIQGMQVYYHPFRNRHFTTNRDGSGIEIPFNQGLGEIASFKQDDQGKPITIIGK